MQPVFPSPIELDPKKFSRRHLQRMVQVVLDDPTKGLVLKYSDGSNAKIHAKLPEFDRPSIDRKQLAPGLVPHILAAEKIIPVDVDPRLINPFPSF